MEWTDNVESVEGTTTVGRLIDVTCIMSGVTDCALTRWSRVVGGGHCLASSFLNLRVAHLVRHREGTSTRYLVHSRVSDT